MTGFLLLGSPVEGKFGGLDETGFFLYHLCQVFEGGLGLLAALLAPVEVEAVEADRVEAGGIGDGLMMFGAVVGLLALRVLIFL